MAHVAAQLCPQRQDGISRLEQGLENRQVGDGGAHGLKVHVVTAEELFDPLYGQILDGVYHLASAHAAAVRISSGVLVGQDASLQGQSIGGGIVFRDDQVQGAQLTLILGAGQLCHLRVKGAKAVHRLGKCVHRIPPFGSFFRIKYKRKAWLEQYPVLFHLVRPIFKPDRPPGLSNQCLT